MCFASALRPHPFLWPLGRACDDGETMSRSRLVLYAHGSRDPHWREPFERLLGDVASHRGGESVRLAYMEFAEPTLMEVAGEAIRDGFGTIRILPLFLAGGAHVAKDIPEQVAAVLGRYPRLEVLVLPPVGEDPRVQALLRTMATEA